MNPFIILNSPSDGRVRVNRKKRPRKYESYVRGPIPEGWLKKAGQISGATLVVGLMLWQKAYMERLWGEDLQDTKSGDITLSNKCLETWGISKRARDRALEKMDDAGLITVKRYQGRLPRIQIIDKELLRPSG